MKEGGDFIYNGIPIFNVGISDFITISSELCRGHRLSTKNILDEALREHYRKTRGMNVGICFEGIIIDLGEYKNSILSD